MAGVLSVAVYVCMQETRSSVLLTRMAQKMRKEMGDQSYRSRAEDEKPDLRTLLMVSATRPICKSTRIVHDCNFAECVLDLVLTEPVAASFSVSRIRSYQESRCSFALVVGRLCLGSFVCDLRVRLYLSSKCS